MPWFIVPCFVYVEAKDSADATEFAAERFQHHSTSECGLYQDEGIMNVEVPGPDAFEPHTLLDIPGLKLKKED